MNEVLSRLNWLDLLLVFIIVSSLIASLVRGFTREIAGFIALVLAILLGLWFHGTVGAFVLPYLSEPHFASIVGFGIIFFVVTTIGALVGSLISKVWKVTGLSIIDRLLGGAFGLAKGVIMAAVVLFAMLAFSPTGPPAALGSSVVAPYVLWSTDALSSLAPRELKDAVESNVTVLRGLWEQVPGLVPGFPGSKIPDLPGDDQKAKPAPSQKQRPSNPPQNALQENKAMHRNSAVHRSTPC